MAGELDGIPWLAAGYQELRNGVHRLGSVGAHGSYVAVKDAGGHAMNNPRILEYFTATTLHTHTEATSWCSAFVNWCMRQSGIVGTRSAAARSWLHWTGGEALDLPVIGAVAVFPRPPSVTNGHVAMVWNIRRDGSFDVLGGNQSAHAANAKRHIAAQSSRVSIGHHAAGTALGFRWPRGVAQPGADMALVTTSLAHS
jgi:uncharacterized protein (TIGR02594 family)